jgi:hypothetical protein
VRCVGAPGEHRALTLSSRLGTTSRSSHRPVGKKSKKQLHIVWYRLHTIGQAARSRSGPGSGAPQRVHAVVGCTQTHHAACSRASSVVHHRGAYMRVLHELLHRSLLPFIQACHERLHDLVKVRVLHCRYGCRHAWTDTCDILPACVTRFN